jgi:hypothetical protein
MNTPNLPAFTYELWEFDALNHATSVLRAPVSDDGMVLVNACGMEPEPALVLEIEHPTIKIARHDNSPLQIAVAQGPRRSRVFTVPVPSLTLDKLETAGLWRVSHAERLGVQYPDILGYFFALVADSAAEAEEKKAKEGEAEWARKILDSFME